MFDKIRGISALPEEIEKPPLSGCKWFLFRRVSLKKLFLARVFGKTSPRAVEKPGGRHPRNPTKKALNIRKHNHMRPNKQKHRCIKSY